MLERALKRLLKWRFARSSASLLWARLTTILVVASLLAVVGTIITFSSNTVFGSQPEDIVLILIVDLILLISLIILVARRAVLLWIERRQGMTGSRLYSKLVVLFSLMAAVPSVTVIIFSTSLFNFGIEKWFTQRVSVALSESLAVAEAYLQEHIEKIRSDTLAAANDLNNNAPLLLNNPERFDDYLNIQANLRSLSEAMVFDSRRNILARSELSFMLEFEPVSQTVISQAREGNVVIISNEAGDRVRALIRLNRFVDAFLYVGRTVDAQVLQHTRATREAVLEYQQVEKNRQRLQLTVTLIFIVITLLLLLASLWFGLLLAHRLVKPIAQLVGAAERVRSGDFATRVPVTEARDELSILARAFNRMTAQLATQHSKLLEANTQLDVRRRFTEAVLEGVSAGVIGLDAHENIQFPNKRAAELLHLSIDTMLGQPIRTIWPEVATHLDTLKTQQSDDVETQITIERDGARKALMLRIKTENVDARIVGYVITFDDLTELISAQKTAAWADVARRLAHEIKNPLTPIQLSAERLARRYGKHITEDKDVFLACTDTIIRQVEDIGRMVDEFSNFARLPRSVRKRNDAVRLCQEILLLFRNAHSDITFSLHSEQEKMWLDMDAGLMRQALTNLVKNAVEAIQDNPKVNTAKNITITLAEDDNYGIITVADSGRGLDGQDISKLTEPYVTTREKGTGLGLAIVKKIMDEHHASLSIQPNSPVGAKIIIKIRKKPLDQSPTNE